MTGNGRAAATGWPAASYGVVGVYTGWHSACSAGRCLLPEVCRESETAIVCFRHRLRDRRDGDALARRGGCPARARPGRAARGGGREGYPRGGRKGWGRRAPPPERPRDRGAEPVRPPVEPE